MSSEQLADGQVKITADTSEVEKKLDAVKAKSQSSISGIIAAFAPLGGALAGAFAIGKTISDFAGAEASLMALQNAVATSGQEVESTMEKFTNFSAALQETTTIGDDTTHDLLKQATAYGLSSDQSIEATRAAVGLSRAYGIDLGTALKGVALEMNGHESALKKTIPALRDIEGATERLAFINEAAAKGMQQEEGATQTLSGAWGRFTNSIGEVSESVGQFLAGGAASILNWATSGILKFSEWVGSLAEWRVAFTDALFGAGGSLSWLGDTINAVFSFLFDVLDTGTFAIINFGMTWDVVKESASNYFYWMKDAAMASFTYLVDVGGWFGRNWYEIFETLFKNTATLFKNLISNIVELFRNLPGLIRGETNFADIWKPLSDGFINTIREDMPKMREIIPDQWSDDAAKKWGQSFAKVREERDKLAAAPKVGVPTSKAISTQLTEQGRKNEQAEKEKAAKKDDKTGFSGVEDIWKNRVEQAFKDSLGKEQLAVAKGSQKELMQIRKSLKNGWASRRGLT